MPGVQLTSVSKKTGDDDAAFPNTNTLSNTSALADTVKVGTTPYQRLVHSLHHNQKLLNEVKIGRRVGFYRFRGDIGSGNFSQVKLAVHDLCKERVAIKILDKSKLDQKTRRMVTREILTVDTIHHPNIIRLYEVVETYNRIYLVFEYAGGGELFNRITTVGRLSESDARVIFAQIISAVRYMHEKNFIHRDIKAENVFFATPTVVKVGDFGFSIEVKEGNHQLLTTFCGSPPYAAPELFRDDSYFGVPVDIWALGVLLYFMVSGNMPFKAQTVASLKKLIIDGNYSVPSFVSNPCKAVIEGILKQSPQDRLTLCEVQNSEWLQTTFFPSPIGSDDNYSLLPTSVQLRKKCEPSNTYMQNVHDSGSISDIESNARAQLNDLGVTENMLLDNIELGARSAIIGMYRIFIHRLQRAAFSTTKIDDEVSFCENADVPGVGQSIGQSISSSSQNFSFCLGLKMRSGTKKCNNTKGRKNHSRTCSLL